MHLKPEGARAYARLLSRAFTWPIPTLEMSLARVAVAEPADVLAAAGVELRSVGRQRRAYDTKRDTHSPGVASTGLPRSKRISSQI